MQLRDVLTTAGRHWRATCGATSAKVQTLRVEKCVEILGKDIDAGGLTRRDAAKILEGLADKNLSRKAIGDYYGAFKRALALCDQSPRGGIAAWPKPPRAPRKTRSILSPEDFRRVVDTLRASLFGETADLATVLFSTGLRVQRELLTEGGIRVIRGGGYDTLHVVGKGDHERELPLVEPEARSILQDKQRLNALLSIPYKTHLARWHTALSKCGIAPSVTLHALRHSYATSALKQSGGNLRLVQELLGHSNPGTTAIYAHVDMHDKVSALTSTPTNNHMESQR